MPDLFVFKVHLFFFSMLKMQRYTCVLEVSGMIDNARLLQPGKKIREREGERKSREEKRGRAYRLDDVPYRYLASTFQSLRIR